MFECIKQEDLAVLKNLNESQRAYYIIDREQGMPSLTDTGAKWFRVYKVFLGLNAVIGPISGIVAGGVTTGLTLLKELWVMIESGTVSIPIATIVMGILTIIAPVRIIGASLLSMTMLKRYWEPNGTNYMIKFMVLGVLSYGLLFGIPLVFMVGIRKSIYTPEYKAYKLKCQINEEDYKEANSALINHAKAYAEQIGEKIGIIGKGSRMIQSVIESLRK